MTKRKTISSGIKAEVIYPAYGSDKSATTEYVNFDLTDDESLNLAIALVQGARLSKKLTVRVTRKKNLSGKHAVTVTSATNDLKKK